MQGLGAGKQQGAVWKAGKVLLLAVLLISLVSHWWRGCSWVYLTAFRPFQTPEIAWILLQGKTHCPFFLHGGKAFFLSHTKVISPDLSFLSGDY